MYPFIQLFLLMLTTLFFHIGLTNPNRRSTSDYALYEGAGSTLITGWGPKLGQLITWIFTLYQALYLCLQAFSPSFIPALYPQLPTSIDPLPLTFISTLGYLLMIVGGLGRIWCYKTLGKFFTFEITIRDSHKLIKTGPYAYVRHPSYTFAFILLSGMLLVHQRLAKFFPKNNSIQIIFGPMGIFICFIITAANLTRRVIREEEVLIKAFGKEYTQYASKTKRFIPNLV